MVGMRVCQPEPLQDYVGGVVRAMGADAEIAGEVARHLVRSNLSGHDSHGVLRIAQYVTQADKGDLVPGAHPTMMRETPVTALIDAHRGFGHFSTAFGLEWAMNQARQHGLAAAAVRHSSHIGRLGEYTERAGEQGLIAILTVGASGAGVGGMVPFGGSRRFLGSNPWSMGIPAKGYAPVVFDGSSSTVAEGKVRFARAKGAALPVGCIQDREGNPTTDPEDFYAGGALVPLGGSVAGHKGYGLALASALIGGLAMIDDAAHTLIGASVVQDVGDNRGQVAGVFLMVINPAWYGNAQHYQALVGENLVALKRTPPATAVEEVLLPGEPEARTRAQRQREGIALPEATWADFTKVSERFGVPLPEHRPA